MNKLPLSQRNSDLNPLIEAINFLLDKEVERDKRVAAMAKAREAKSSSKIKT